MKKSDIKACIMRIEGTNCEDETERAFEKLGVNGEIVHLNQLIGSVSEEKKRKLSDYDILMLPGGFSAGDYVSSGTIMAARIRAGLYGEMRDFVDEGKPVGGICNGFQVLLNLGLLDTRAALTTNRSARFECRPVFLEKVHDCAFSHLTGENICLPVAHGEGRFVFSPGEEGSMFKELEENEQIVFTYSRDGGGLADGEYPYNPNGSFRDIAAICSREKNVFGLMPHPERVLENFEQHDWTRSQGGCAYVKPMKSLDRGDGFSIFESVVSYVERGF